MKIVSVSSNSVNQKQFVCLEDLPKKIVIVLPENLTLKVAGEHIHIKMIYDKYKQRLDGEEV